MLIENILLRFFVCNKTKDRRINSFTRSAKLNWNVYKKKTTTAFNAYVHAEF